MYMFVYRLVCHFGCFCRLEPRILSLSFLITAHLLTQPSLSLHREMCVFAYVGVHISLLFCVLF